MRKKELIDALKKVGKGIEEVVAILSEEETSNKEVTKETKAVEEAPVVEATNDEVVEGRFSKEELDAMKYNDLKKLGKELGVKCVGTREEITAKIMSIPKEEEETVMNPPVEEEATEDKVVPISKKKKPVKEEVAKDDSEDEVEEKYLAMAREALEDNELEEIVEVLEEAGIKLTKIQSKKADVVMTKLAEAFQSGVIEVEDEEDEEEETESEEDVLEFSEDSYFEQYDTEGINNPKNMTKDRLKAVKEMVADIINSYEEDELTSEDIEKELEDIVTDEDLELLGEDYDDDELVAFYIEMKKRFIDNDGDMIDPSEPYEVGEDDFCCGHKLTYDKKGKKYVCSVCEEEYEAE